MSCSEWKESKLGEISLKITKGSTPTTLDSEFSDKGIKFYRSECLTDSRIIDKNKAKYISKETYDKMKRSQLFENDILFSMAGAYLGKTSIVMKDDIPANINQAVAIIRPDCESISYRYLYYYLNQKRVVEYVNNISSQSAQPNINLKQIGEIPIKYPKLEEQEKIADVLSFLDYKIELNNEMNKTLEEMAQSIFKRWFVDFEFLNEDGQPYKSSGGEMVESELGMIPKGWKVTNIDDICMKVTSGGTPSRKNKDYYDGDIIWIKTKELNDTFVFDSEEKISSIGLEKSSAKLFPSKTVMIAMYGATVGKLGISSTMITFNQATCGMVVNTEACCYEYLYLHLINQREKLKNLAIGSAQQNLSVSVIKEYNIIKPIKQVMEKFKNVINPIYDKIECNQNNIQNLKSLRDELLPKLMRNEIK